MLLLLVVVVVVVLVLVVLVMAMVGAAGVSASGAAGAGDSGVAGAGDGRIRATHKEGGCGAERWFQKEEEQEDEKKKEEEEEEDEKKKEEEEEEEEQEEIVIISERTVTLVESGSFPVFRSRALFYLVGGVCSVLAEVLKGVGVIRVIVLRVNILIFALVPITLSSAITAENGAWNRSSLSIPAGATASTPLLALAAD
ncbi:hypothetical protein FOCC_FOCC011821 [Frankliniella occidentalis]|nr:hypothetical protein FOCC_FOCC011821 [Frankliniella occidentalis]